MKLKHYIEDVEKREWLLSADIDGIPFETEDGQGNSFMAADVDFDDIFCERTNEQGKGNILYYKNMDDMEKSGLFSKNTLKELDIEAQVLVLQSRDEWRQCGYDLAQ